MLMQASIYILEFQERVTKLLTGVSVKRGPDTPADADGKVWIEKNADNEQKVRRRKRKMRMAKNKYINI